MKALRQAQNDNACSVPQSSSGNSRVLPMPLRGVPTTRTPAETGLQPGISSVSVRFDLTRDRQTFGVSHAIKPVLESGIPRCGHASMRRSGKHHSFRRFTSIKQPMMTASIFLATLNREYFTSTSIRPC